MYNNVKPIALQTVHSIGYWHKIARRKWGNPSTTGDWWEGVIILQLQKLLNVEYFIQIRVRGCISGLVYAALKYVVYKYYFSWHYFCVFVFRVWRVSIRWCSCFYLKHNCKNPIFRSRLFYVWDTFIKTSKNRSFNLFSIHTVIYRLYSVLHVNMIWYIPNLPMSWICVLYSPVNFLA